MTYMENMMKKTIAISALALMSTACLTTYESLEPKDPAPGKSLVAFYVDMEQASSLAEWGWIKAEKPKNGQINFKVQSVESDKYGTILFAQNLPPGNYYVERVSGIGKDTYNRFNYTLGSKKSPLIKFKVAKQGVYYLGSYKYIKVKSKFGKKSMDDFHFAVDKKAPAKNVLNELADDIGNAKLRKMIENSIAGKS